MRKPRIGLMSRKLEGKEYFAIIEGAREAIIRFGGIPIVLLSVQKEDARVEPEKAKKYSKQEKEDLEQLLALCDGFLLPGGDSWYELDELTIDYARKKDLPLLGICLGMQTLGKIFSKEKQIAKDNTILNNTKINHCQLDNDKVHKVQIKKESKLFEIIGKREIMVNSRHNYHIKEIEEKYISARSPDGLIEGIEDPNNTFCIGVQWHPENLIEKDAFSKKLFKTFFEVVRRKMEQGKRV